MELRWYQTYDKNGVDSEMSLQFRHEYGTEWENVEFVREREDNEDN